MTFILFERISKTYAGGRIAAVRDLDLGIERGEFLSLLGPSGSGKTTTLMLLAGFERPTSGSITLDGRRIETLAPYERGMGVVFQSYSLFAHMSVAGNVAFPLEVRKVPRAEIRARVAGALAKVRLERHADRRPAQLSGGEQQRVALARALVFDPHLVLMDEPLSALDKNLREELQLEIRRLHREVGVTMVFVTHDQSEAMTLSDRIAVFRGGRLVQVGAPDALYDRPADAFVAGFVGDNNRVRGTVLAIEREAGLTRIALGDRTLTGCADAPGLAVGGTATFCIRPEAIRIGDHAAGAPGTDRVGGRIVDAINRGDHWRVLVSVDLAEARGPWTVRCARPPAGLTVGAQVSLEFPHASARIVPDGETPD